MDNYSRIVSFVTDDLLNPTQIAKACGLTFDEVAREIGTAVLSGQLSRSQVQSTLDRELLRQVGLFAGHRSKWPLERIRELLRECFDCDLSIEEIKFYIGYCGKDYRSGETYELLAEIERTLHAQIKEVLTDEHGPKETGWWRKGVPPKVRKECASKREGDELFSGDDAYAYTTLIML
ncbi:hypothetical protein SBV1_3480014 [Verrucomicrobia bacterium]|nr:hypothetical protein SBV1_3480014 [Verrucomicrobiota bacterium]